MLLWGCGALMELAGSPVGAGRYLQRLFFLKHGLWGFNQWPTCCLENSRWIGGVGTSIPSGPRIRLPHYRELQFVPHIDEVYSPCTNLDLNWTGLVGFCSFSFFISFCQRWLTAWCKELRWWCPGFMRQTELPQIQVKLCAFQLCLMSNNHSF